MTRLLAGASRLSAMTASSGVGVKQNYLETIRLIERLHRRFLDVIKTELDRLGITLDTDPRKATRTGAAKPADDPAAPSTDDQQETTDA